MPKTITIDLDPNGKAKVLPAYWSWGDAEKAVIKATQVSRSTIYKARRCLGFEGIPTQSEVDELILSIRFCGCRNSNGGDDCTYAGYARHRRDGTLAARIEQLGL